MNSIPVGDFFYVPAGQAQEFEDLRRLLQQPAGRRLFRRLLSAGKVMGVIYGKDARSTEYNEGLRAMGLWLAVQIETAVPGEIARLMLESSQDRPSAQKTRAI